jgi:uncharacterized protein (TIGR00255 family)
MYSMTGMGRAAGEVLGQNIRVEIKAVNHRFCEVNTKLLPWLYPVEFKIVSEIKKQIARGKVDVYFGEDRSGDASAATFEAYEKYHAFLKSLQERLGLSGEISLSNVLQMSGSWSDKSTDPDELWKVLQPLLNKALNEFKEMRAHEGEVLKADMEKRFSHVERVKDDVQKLSGEIQESMADRLKERIAKKMEQLDEGRLDEQRLHSEVLYHLDKQDITEELKRLESHFLQVKKFFEMTEPVGRKFDFLLQEFGREFNTIASKAQDDRVAHLVVEAKAELEKIREQVQNIE